MARRKADKIDVGQNFEKPERKKRESKGVAIYRVVPQEGVTSMYLLEELGSEKDLKSALKTIQSLAVGDFAIGRLTFRSLEEQIVKKTVLVKK